MQRLKTLVLTVIVALNCFTYSLGYNNGVIEDIVRRLESVERNNAILRQNDINLRRIIRHQQKEIHILQNSVNHETTAQAQMIANVRNQMVADHLIDGVLVENLDNLRQDVKVLDKHHNDIENVSNTRKDNSVVSNNRLNEKSATSMRQDDTKYKSAAIEATHNSNIYDHEGSTKRRGIQGRINHEHQGINQMLRSVQVNSEYVAFHATSDQGTVSHLRSGQIVIFEHVHLNIGTGYHSNGGNFIAPKPGLYLLSVSVLSYGIINTNLEKNGLKIASVHCHGHHGNDADQGSVTVVMDLKAGDEVYVKVDERDRNGEFTLYGDRYTTFTGILLKEL